MTASTNPGQHARDTARLLDLLEDWLSHSSQIRQDLAHFGFGRHSDPDRCVRRVIAELGDLTRAFRRLSIDQQMTAGGPR